MLAAACGCECGDMALAFFCERFARYHWTEATQNLFVWSRLSRCLRLLTRPWLRITPGASMNKTYERRQNPHQRHQTHNFHPVEGRRSDWSVNRCSGEGKDDVSCHRRGSDCLLLLITKRTATVCKPVAPSNV